MATEEWEVSIEFLRRVATIEWEVSRRVATIEWEVSNATTMKR